MTRGELIAKVSRKLSFNQTVGHQDRLFLEGVANEAVREMLLRTHCYVDLGNMALTAGVTTYRLNVSILAILEAEVTGSLRTIQVVPMTELMKRARGVSYQDLPFLIASSGNFVRVYPPPAAGATIQFTYVPRPTAMTADANDPATATYGGVPEELHQGLEYYMLWQGAEYDEKVSKQDATYYQQQYEAQIILGRRRLRGQMGRALVAPRGAGYPESPNRPPSRNDTYPRS